MLIISLLSFHIPNTSLCSSCTDWLLPVEFVSYTCDPNYRVEPASEHEWINTKPYCFLFLFLHSCFISYISELKTLLRANTVLCVATRNPGDIQKEDLALALMELQVSLGILWEDKTLSLELVNTGGPSTCKQTVKYKCNTESEVVDEEVGTDLNGCSQKGLLSTKGWNNLPKVTQYIHDWVIS